MKEFIEQKIIDAVKKILTGRVNEIMQNWEFLIPIIEFGNIGSNYAVAPVLNLTSCEQTEKERIIRLNAYSLSITLKVREHEDSELYCHGYSFAFEKALGENNTLGGIVDRAVITGKKYVQPKKPNCGQDWELVISLQISVEETIK